MSTIHYEVLVHPPIPQAKDQLDADGNVRTWSPISTTFVVGEQDVVVVDPGMTLDQARAVGDRVDALGRRLTAVYATHGHGDHWFATAPLLERFDGVRVYATPGTTAVMADNVAHRAAWFDAIFPGQIPTAPVTAIPVSTEGFDLEGHRLLPVETGHTDTDRTTVLHVPSIGLVVAGDVVYRHVHQYLAEAGNGGLQVWLDARELLATTTTAREFYEAVLERHPTRINRGALWRGATALKP